MRIIVGLGNPGAEYERTRHNAGFDVLELLAADIGVKFQKLQGKAKVADGLAGGEKFLLARPQTFMNLSGESVRALMDFYKLSPEQLLVVYDDIDLPLGRLRVRKSGSAGTHNGMRSIIGCLGTEGFARLRVGVGAPPPGWELARYVLSGYHTKEERDAAFSGYEQAVKTARAWLECGIEEAMRLGNAPPAAL